jgi:neutral ceramidase
MHDILLAGACEMDITPPVGTALAGSTSPRVSKGIEDPLYVKALVLESGGTRIAYVTWDLLALSRAEGDRAVTQASARTGIPEENIMWAASHTHTGPYTVPVFGSEEGGIDREWLSGLPDRCAECVARADAAKVPVKMSRMRGYCFGAGVNRRVRFKDGREINSWLIEGAGDTIQSVGTAGPIDPEVGILSFEDSAGKMVAVLFHFTLHANANFSRYFSGDYPAVVAARLRERFGGNLVTLFAPGACADINPLQKYRATGDMLADVILSRLQERTLIAGQVSLGAMKRDITVPYRDLSRDQEKRILDAHWGERDSEVFRRELEIMREEGVTEISTVLQAWHIGDVAFASLPGELFVEWGMKIKQESLFPWTYPVELGGDYIGYMVTRRAWNAGGYESLIARSAKPSVEGVERMVHAALEMLKELRGLMSAATTEHITL